MAENKNKPKTKKTTTKPKPKAMDRIEVNKAKKTTATVQKKNQQEAKTTKAANQKKQSTTTKSTTSRETKKSKVQKKTPTTIEKAPELVGNTKTISAKDFTDIMTGKKTPEEIAPAMDTQVKDEVPTPKPEPVQTEPEDPWKDPVAVRKEYLKMLDLFAPAGVTTVTISQSSKKLRKLLKMDSLDQLSLANTVEATFDIALTADDTKNLTRMPFERSYQLIQSYVNIGR